MGRRAEWQKVLDSEVARLSAMPAEELVSALPRLEAYEVALDSKTYQVEVSILENTDKYLHVLVAVDDGSLPASLVPLTHDIILQKQIPNTHASD